MYWSAQRLAFSCRERAATMCQNATDLAREAVSWNARLCENYSSTPLDRV